MKDDDLIREAIQEEENELSAALESDAIEEAYTEAIIQSFRGRQRWILLFLIGVALLCVGLMALCGYQLYQAETTKSQIGWAAGLVIFFVATSQAEMWIGNEWQRYSLAREIKRLELTILDLRNRVAP